eukprot:4811296-Alexandrium_andersonii.AAC.1
MTTPAPLRPSDWAVPPPLQSTSTRAAQAGRQAQAALPDQQGRPDQRGRFRKARGRRDADDRHGTNSSPNWSE